MEIQTYKTTKGKYTIEYTYIFELWVKEQKETRIIERYLNEKEAEKSAKIWKKIYPWKTYFTIKQPLFI